MEKEIIKYNELPVITFRWLKVNDIKVEKLSEKNQFDSNYIVTGKENIEIIDSVNKLALPSEFENYEGSNKEEIADIILNAGIINKISTKENEATVELKYDLGDNNLVEVNYIVAEENQIINVITDYNSDNAKISKTLNILYAKKNSTINLTRVNKLGYETRNMDQRYSIVEEDASVNYISIDLGAKESIVNYLTDLKGKNSLGNLKAIYVGNKDRLIDLHHNIHHFGKQSNSDMEIRGVLLDNAKKYFRGTLSFKKGSTQSEGSEVETVLLLNKGVKNISVPLLLCQEDDVIGNHAASAGQIDEDKLFYLMSRGFSEVEAKRIVVESSFRPIIDTIKDETMQEDILNTIHEIMEKAKG